MNEFLTEICAKKLDDIKEAKSKVRMSQLIHEVAEQSPPRGFAAALMSAINKGHFGLIAEIKKASPSYGLIRENFDPKELANSYSAGGAACLSILTNNHYFQGSESDLKLVISECSAPVLRNDIMLDPYQIIESRAWGADCIVLIIAALEDQRAKELEQVAFDLDMDVLIEVHNATEFERALKLRSPLIVVNNRDPKTMVTDLTTTETLATACPTDRVLIAESGLKTRADLDRMAAAGVKRFLVGEALLRQKNITEATRKLLQG